jgi:AcrR family transcriptional regulator
MATRKTARQAEPRAGTQRTGGRSARVKQAALQSALQELVEVGYADFSIAGVARRAGVHETTLYRRWPRREDLIIDAAMHFADQRLPVPDTGKLEEDLRIVVGNIARLIESPAGQALLSASIALQGRAEFRALILGFWQQRIQTGQVVFERGAERGEWPRDYDRPEAFAELIGPLLARRYLLQQALTPDVLEARVQAMLSIRQR